MGELIYEQAEIIEPIIPVAPRQSGDPIIAGPSFSSLFRGSGEMRKIAEACRLKEGLCLNLPCCHPMIYAAL